MRNVGEMTLMSHFAQADHPVSGGVRRIALATEGLRCAYSLSNSATTTGIPGALPTGSGGRGFCTARHAVRTMAGYCRYRAKTHDDAE